MKSVFTDKAKKPAVSDLKKALGNTYQIWETLVDFTKESYPGASDEWKFTSEKFGWSFRISDKKRVLIYLLPRDRFFKAAFVFGQKATDEILASKISDDIKKELKAAKVYAEGRGIRMEVRDGSLVKDLKKLISVKISS